MKILCFQYFYFFKKILKNENLFFKKLENSFVVESTTIERATYPYKTALSEANVKTNRMGSTKWTYHKEHSFASIFFIFVKILFQYKNLLQRVDLKYQLPKRPFILFESTADLVEGAFSLRVSLKPILLQL